MLYPKNASREVIPTHTSTPRKGVTVPHLRSLPVKESSGPASAPANRTTNVQHAAPSANNYLCVWERIPRDDFHLVAR